jgi:hypothetical protein
MAKKSTARASTSRASSRRNEEDVDMPEERLASRSRSNASREGEDSSPRDLRSMLRDLAANPAVRYVAGGIATAVLTRVATNMSEKYPEISKFISENLENVEGKLGDFRNGLTGDSARQH